MQKASIETNHAVTENPVQIGRRGRCGGLPQCDRALSGYLVAAKACICAHRSVNFGLRMANTEGTEAFCVGRADLTCCVARRWLLSAVRRVHERKFLPMSIVDQCDAAMFAAYFGIGKREYFMPLQAFARPLIVLICLP